MKRKPATSPRTPQRAESADQPSASPEDVVLATSSPFAFREPARPAPSGPAASLSVAGRPRASGSRGPAPAPREPYPDIVFEDAYRLGRSNLQVLIRGTVARWLPDDLVGDRHQRFILRLESGMTVLVAHNIDIGERLPEDAWNEIVDVHGEYEWNPDGGVLHWTHVDPDGRHADGWIFFDGMLYQ